MLASAAAAGTGAAGTSVGLRGSQTGADAAAAAADHYGWLMATGHQSRCAAAAAAALAGASLTQHTTGSFWWTSVAAGAPRPTAAWSATPRLTW